MTKVNKALARKMYNNGASIYLLPCKVGLNSIWVSPLEIKNTHDEENFTNFDKRVSEYAFYNCCSELGAYTSFYIK